MKKLKIINGEGRNFVLTPVLLLNQKFKNTMMNLKSTLEVLVKVIVLVVMAFILLVGMQGCQKEEEVIIETPEDQVMTTESPVYSNVLRVATSDGSADNILDKSSCTSIALPVTVIVKDIEITIDSDQDFVIIEKLFDEFGEDLAELSFIFPITIILSDHTEVVIENAGQLEDIIAGCPNTDDDDDIECVDFIYPIKISVYNSDNQVADVKEFHNDEEFYHFLHELKENEFCGINFPIKLLLPDGTEVEVSDNFELNDLIEDVKNDCDEDDDNDYNDDDVDDSDLVGVLLEGKWYISYYLDETDQAGQFDGYLFDFFENGKVVVFNDNEEYHGEWESSGDDGTLKLELFFSEETPFTSLNENWLVLEFDGKLIKLYNNDDSNISEKILKFERYVYVEPALTVSDVLPEGKWIVAKFDDSGEIKTSVYNDFEIDFTAEGAVFATKGEDIVQGSWDEVTDGEVHKLILNFGEVAPFDEFNEDWVVVAVREDRVEVKHVGEGEEGTDVLVFERLM